MQASKLIQIFSFFHWFTEKKRCKAGGWMRCGRAAGHIWCCSESPEGCRFGGCLWATHGRIQHWVGAVWGINRCSSSTLFPRANRNKFTVAGMPSSNNAETSCKITSMCQICNHWKHSCWQKEFTYGSLFINYKSGHLSLQKWSGFTKLNYTTLHYITLHNTPLHSPTQNYTTLHHITLRYATFHYTPPHFTTLHYTSLQYTAWHCTTDSRQVER